MADELRPGISVTGDDPGPDRWAHQGEATTALARALGGGGRAILEMACGTGKSAVAAKAVDRLTPFGRVLIAVPNLELVAQMVGTFRAYGTTGLGQVVGVCSNSEIRYLPRGEGLSSYPRVTTRPAEVAAWTAVGGRVTVLTTYHSLPVIAAAHADHGMPAWDLLIADEAHRTAGRPGSPWTRIHDDVAFPAARRLYMTATRRIYEDGGEATAVSMDDEKVFGPVAYRLSFGEGYRRGLVAGYEIVAAAVTDGAVKALTDDPDARVKLDRAAVSPRVLATQITVLRAAAEYGVRRAITFHNRVADARGWAQTIGQAWSVMPPDQRPAAVSASFIHGDQDLQVRKATLQRLRDSAADPGELRIVCNARVLTEGVDAPAVDSVVIVDPRSSVVDIVQSVGRALRADRPGKVARIIVPVFMEPGDDPETVVEGSEFAKVWQVLRAMRAHDERLAANLDARRLSVGTAHTTRREADTPPAGHDARASDTAMPAWLSLTGIPVPAGFARAITLRAVTAASSSWWEAYGAAKQLHDSGQDVNVPATYVTESGLRLGQWVRSQSRHRATLPAERIALLEEIGMVWNRTQHVWDQALAAARAFASANGNSLHGIPTGYIENGVRLGRWLIKQRTHYRAGTLAPELKAALDAIDPTWHDGDHAIVAEWEAHYCDARDYFTQHGHLRPPDDYRPPSGRDLGAWLKRQRIEHRAKRLSAERHDRLCQIGMVWSILDDGFRRGLAVARAYAAEHGNLTVPVAFVTDDGFHLGSWLYQRRRRVDTLPIEQRRALNEIDPQWAARRR
ncbi:Helicase associated domain protein [Sphaerisporangium melleum]|nr:DEAD/DEAH box helicase [Sphaerisporangium melleum]